MERPTIMTEEGWVHPDDLSPNVILYRNIGEDEARDIKRRCGSTRILAVTDVKGGVKKTTAAVNIAMGIHRYTGKRVSIADCDQYHSVADWRQEAQEQSEKEDSKVRPWPDDVQVLTSSGDLFHFDLVEHIEAVRPDYMVIDTPPNDEDAALRALIMADLMLMPTGPFQMDIRRLSYGIGAAATAQSLRGLEIDVVALITGARQGTVVYNQARDYLRAVGVPFINMPVRDLVAHAQAFGTHLPKLHDYDLTIDEIIPRLESAHREY